MANMFSTEDLNARVRFIEYEITKAALRGTNLVPTATDRVYINSLANELFRLSEGKNEVIFDKLGRPSIMVNFYADEKSRCEYLASSNTLFDSAETGLPKIHPAFLIDNAPIAGFRLGKYQACRVNGVNYAVSLYRLPPAFSISAPGVFSLIDAANAGGYAGDDIHMITQAEFAFIGLLSAREAFQCRGNDSYGKSYLVASESGEPCGPLSNSGDPLHIKTGTGPLQWRHDGTPFGVSDLRGNVSEWVAGYRCYGGELRFIPNNNSAKKGLVASDHLITSSLYKSLLEANVFGDVANADSMKYDYILDPGTESESKSGIQVCKTLTYQQQNNNPYASVALSGMTAASGLTVPGYLKLMLMYPLLTGTPQGTVYMRNTAGTEYGVHRGGYWNGNSFAGFAYSHGSSNPSNGDTGVGFRVASLI